MKTTVLVHILDGKVKTVKAIGDGEIDVVVFNQNVASDEPLQDEGVMVHCSHLNKIPKAEADFEKQCALGEIERKIKEILDSDDEKFRSLEQLAMQNCDNNCKVSDCHRCYPRKNCIKHEKCNDFTRREEAYVDY